MKLGLYVTNERQTAGGAFVVREDLAQAALRAQGRHSIELLNANAAPAAGTITRPPNQAHLLASRAIASLKLSKLRKQAKVQRLKQEVERKGVQMLWFNHTSPIDIGVPYMLSVFDVLHRLQPWFPEVSADGVWERREAVWVSALRRASIVIAPSEATKQDISFLFNVPSDRIRVVPFPTPTSALEAMSAVTGGDIRMKYGIGHKFLYYPAQFWPHKNHVNLLHALQILNRQLGIKMDLVLTGSDHGNLAHVRETAHILGLEERVHFLGFVPRKDLIALYREAFALTFVSFFGPENLPPLEAQAIGCPVVLSDIPGTRPLYGDGPVLVSPKDPQNIAEGIARLQNEPALRARGIETGRVNARRHTCDHYIEAIFDILDDFENIRRCWP